MTITAGRAFSPIEYQTDMMKSHVTRGVPVATKTDGGRTLQLAVPAEWTKQAKCVGDFVTFTNLDRLRPGEAGGLCAGCPVIAECLSAAMSEEHGLSAGNRYGVRGGLSPKERAELAFAERECERGHVGRWGGHVNTNLPVCLECKAEDKREAHQGFAADPEWRDRRNARVKEARSVRRVSCAACRTEMRTYNLGRHLARCRQNNGKAAA